MQAITTKYLGPTNFRGARIKATAEAGSVTVDFPYEFSGADAHAVAALALARKIGWDGDLLAGGTADGYVFVFSESQRYPVATTDEEHEELRRTREERMAARLARP